MKNSVTKKVLVKVRDDCFEGEFRDASIHVLRGKSTEESIIPNSASQNYAALGKTREITETKHKHLQQMFRDYIRVIVILL